MLSLKAQQGRKASKASKERRAIKAIPVKRATLAHRELLDSRVLMVLLGLPVLMALLVGAALGAGTTSLLQRARRVPMAPAAHAAAERIPCSTAACEDTSREYTAF